MRPPLPDSVPPRAASCPLTVVTPLALLTSLHTTMVPPSPWVIAEASSVTVESTRARVA